VSATTHGLASGIVFGLVAVLLGQQFGYYSLSDLATAITYLVIGMVVGGAIFAVIGWALGRRYLHKHPEDVPPAQG
jgi:tetrahydromethanopterin S-methyltransferase subunit C